MRCRIDNSGKHQGYNTIPAAHAPLAQRATATSKTAADAEQRWLPLSAGEAGESRADGGETGIMDIDMINATDTAATAKQRVIIVLKARFRAVRVRRRGVISDMIPPTAAATAFSATAAATRGALPASTATGAPPMGEPPARG